jgi:zinc/manganese transport system substrate-binding protein
MVRSGVCLLAVLLLAACSGGVGDRGRASRRIQGTPPEQAAPGEPPRSTRVVTVVSTSSVVSDLLRLVGSTNVRTHTVVKAGLDPLSYRVTSADKDQARRADIILAVGRGLEPWLGDLGGRAPVLLSTGLPERASPAGIPDPFVWHDPANAKAMLKAIADALTAVDPPDGPAFSFSADAAGAKIDRADAEAQRLLGPRAGRAFVTTKDTMGWFAARYGLVVAGSIIPSPDSTGAVTPQHITDLKAAIRDKGVLAVFGEVSIAAGPAVALAREAGLTAVTGSDALCGDGLGTAGTDADTYIGCLTHNAKELAANL